MERSDIDCAAAQRVSAEALIKRIHFNLGAGAFGVTVLLMSDVVSQDPEVLGGDPVFAGTRVPVKSLFEHLEAGDSIDEFLNGFPSVRREQVIALLEDARTHVVGRKAGNPGKRSTFPLFSSRSPGSLDLTKTDLARLEAEEDARLHGRSA